MSEKFKIGTVVCLKSGGPPMTVEYAPPEFQVTTSYVPNLGFVQVQWFAGDIMKRDSIHPDCLEPAVLMDEILPQEARVLSS